MAGLKFMSDKTSKIIEAGKEIVSGSITGAIGFYLGNAVMGPGGAIAGGALGGIVGNVLTDISNRVLSHREEVRIGAASIYIQKRIQDNINNGQEPRKEFLDVNQKKKEAEELFEGVLLKAKTEHEEKKIKLISNIFVRTVFINGIDIAQANYFLSAAERMTYTHFCLLAMVAYNINNSLRLKGSVYRGQVDFNIQARLQTLNDLYNEGYIIQTPDDQHSESNQVLFGIGDIIVSRLKLSALGRQLGSMLSLNELDKNDIEMNTKLLQ